MFKNLFSFEGRILRLEYTISLLIFVTALWGIRPSIREEDNMLYAVCFIPSFWFILARGAKRCHDAGKNGCYQAIPFYFLVMTMEVGGYDAN